MSNWHLYRNLSNQSNREEDIDSRELVIIGNIRNHFQTKHDILRKHYWVMTYHKTLLWKRLRVRIHSIGVRKPIISAENIPFKWEMQWRVRNILSLCHPIIQWTIGANVSPTYTGSGCQRERHLSIDLVFGSIILFIGYRMSE